MKKILATLILASSSGLTLSSLGLQSNNQLPIKNNVTRDLKYNSNYVYHESWASVNFYETNILINIYKYIDNLFSDKTVSNINISNELCIQGKNKSSQSYDDINGTLENVNSDIQTYIDGGMINPDFYQNISLQGHEHYKWHWIPAYAMYKYWWDYKAHNDTEFREAFSSHENSGLGPAPAVLNFKISLNYTQIF